MTRITGSWELRYIMNVTDVEALESVRDQLNRRIETLKRLSRCRSMADGDRVQFVRNGQTVVGTLYRLRLEEAWVKGDDGTVYIVCPPDLVPASSSLAGTAA